MKWTRSNYKNKNSRLNIPITKNKDKKQIDTIANPYLIYKSNFLLLIILFLNLINKKTKNNNRKIGSTFSRVDNL